MNKGKALAYVEEWKNLERTQKDLDFERSEWARRVRAEFPRGIAGNRTFAEWCMTDLGLAKRQIDELILRATAAEVITDRAAWSRAGGFARIKYLDEFARNDQVAVLETVKSTGNTIQAVVAHHGLRPAKERVNAYRDAVTLALFVRSLKLKLPANIKEIVERYELEPAPVPGLIEKREHVKAVVERHKRERAARS